MSRGLSEPHSLRLTKPIFKLFSVGPFLMGKLFFVIPFYFSEIIATFDKVCQVITERWVLFDIGKKICLSGSCQHLERHLLLTSLE